MTVAVALVRRVVPDPALLLAVGLLVALGLVMIRAATMPAPGELSGEVLRQLFYGVTGAGALVGASRLHTNFLRRLAPLIYAGSIASLLLVLALGSEEFGARRWIALGPVTVQPSEFAKIATVIAVAAYAADREPGAKVTIVSLGLALLPMALVLVEPDLGTTLVLGAAWVMLVAAWGVSWRVIGGMALLAVSILPIAFAVAVPDYQRERLDVFFHPDEDPLGSGFTMRQVEIALGAGGVTGQGIDGAPSALDGVATRASDFAFAQLAEQMGLAGALIVLVLFGLVAWRGLEAALHSPDRFGRLLAGGLTATIVLQALMHVAVNTHLFPATGIPLPFISTGGSALVGMCISVGLILAVASQRSSAVHDLWSGHSP